MMMHKATPSEDYNKRWTRLDTKLNKPTKKIKKSHQSCWANKKLYYKTLGTSVITAQYPLPPWVSGRFNQGHGGVFWKA